MKTTVKDFLALIEPLRHLPEDTTLTMGFGRSAMWESDDALLEECAAVARRQLLMGDDLQDLLAEAVVVEHDSADALCARLVVDCEWAVYSKYGEWRDYVYREALSLGIIEPQELKPEDNETDSNHRGAAPDPGLYPGGRDFDPDHDRIGY